MTRATAASRLARVAAMGGGSAGLLGAALYGVVRIEAAVARMRIGPALLEPPDPSGLRAPSGPAGRSGWPCSADSAAAGYGATAPDETFGGWLASGLSALTGRPVSLVARAAVGAQSADLAAQIRSVCEVPPSDRPQVVALVIGANDVTHRVPPSRSVASLREAVQLLRSLDIQVVVGTCPDLGTVRPLIPPLRQVARRWSRRLAAAQTIAVVESGGRSVSLGAMLGPDFDREPAVMFGPDRFHPSPAGYLAVATAMLPSVADVLGLLPEQGDEPPIFSEQATFVLARAAAEAAEQPGSEVSQSAGASRLARLRRRLPTRPRIVGRTPNGVTDVVLDEKRAEWVVSAGPIGQALGTDLGTEQPSTGR